MFLCIDIGTRSISCFVLTLCLADSSRSDGERRHGLHAGQRQTRRLDGKAGQPADEERLLYRHVSSGGPEVLIDGATPPSQSAATRKGVEGAARGCCVTTGGEIGDTNPSDSVNRDTDPLLSILLHSTCWAWLSLPAALQHHQPPNLQKQHHLYPGWAIKRTSLWGEAVLSQEKAFSIILLREQTNIGVAVAPECVIFWADPDKLQSVYCSNEQQPEGVG